MDVNFNGYINVFNNRIDDMIKISIQERDVKGNGILFLDFTNKDKLDVFYISLYDKDTHVINEKFPKHLINYLIDKIGSVPPSVIFFNLFDGDSNLNLEIDLEKDSEYTNYCLEKSKNT
tara:strand:- start:1076 stop:1432 length:357 start_codon:yes stop_codon:yes gene_type:complete